MRPAYKDHPLWMEAMALTHDAYALAARLVGEGSSGAAGSLRKAAVAVPARIANALDPACGNRDEEILLARGAVAELLRQAERSGAEAAGLAARAAQLERAMVFELAVPESFS